MKIIEGRMKTVSINNHTNTQPACILLLALVQTKCFPNIHLPGQTTTISLLLNIL